jgi:hypothetical protein
MDNLIPANGRIVGHYKLPELRYRPSPDRAILIPEHIEPAPLTPEWLLAHGFELLTGDNMPPAFDVSIRGDNASFRLLIEKGIHRNQFCVVMEQMSYTDSTIWYDTAIWMQDNIGCGFGEIPDSIISEWTVERFQALYFALRGEKLQTKP